MPGAETATKPVNINDLPADISERLNNFWNSQVAATERLQQFHKEHPHPGFSDGFTEEDRKAYQDWSADLAYVTRRLGIPDGYTDRLRFDEIRKTWTLKVPPEALYSLDRNFQSMPSPRLFQCRGCQGIFLVDSGSGHSHKVNRQGELVANGYQSWRSVCSDACQQLSDERKAEANKARRKERNAKRSEALASRKGRCRVCGELFTLKRVTGKTCSDRCKKALQRNPDRYAIKEPPSEIQLPDGVKMPISEYVSKLVAASNKLLFASIQGGLDADQQKRADQIKEQIAKYRPMADSRYEFEQCVSMWLVDHPEAMSR